MVRNGFVDLHMSNWGRAEGEDSVFLADVVADPGESKNLRHEHPEVTERLLALHDRWREGVSP